jgi:hypothetical protein
VAAVTTSALAASSPSPDATTPSVEAVAAQRAALDTEPKPVVTAEMRALLAAKDKEAKAYYSKKMAAASAKKFNSASVVDRAVIDAAARGDALARPCPDGDCSWNAIAATQQPQTRNYYCGPATLVMSVANRNISISQDTAAGVLGTTTDGTAWFNGSYPMANALNKYQGPLGASYAAVNLAGYPSSSAVADYKTHLVSNIDRKWAIAGNAYEIASGLHLNGHPPQNIQHWIEIRGYEGFGTTTWYADPASGASSISWSNKVPAYSTMDTNTIVTIMGGRGYVW